jgi:IclR family acetate operon transcriptional repressor
VVDHGGVQSLERALDLLEELAQSSAPISLSELSRRAGLPPPTAHRLMATFVTRGYARRTHDRRYEPGHGLLAVADGLTRVLVSWGGPYLRSVAERIGETANLTILDGDEIVYVAQAPGRHAMRTFTQVGTRVLPYWTAEGRALLALRSDPEVLAALRRTAWPPEGGASGADPAGFLGVLASVRRDGFAVSDEDHEPGARAVAVAVDGAAPPTALSVSGPVQRLDDALVARAADVLAEVAGDMAEYLRLYCPRRSAEVRGVSQSRGSVAPVGRPWGKVAGVANQPAPVPTVGNGTHPPTSST